MWLYVWSESLKKLETFCYHQFRGKLIYTFSRVVRDQCVYKTLAWTLTLTFQLQQHGEMPGDHNGEWISMVPAVHAFPATQQNHDHMSH